MPQITFQKLTEQLEAELNRLHYTEATIVSYRRVWKHLSHFLNDKGTEHFTEELGMQFLQARYLFMDREKAGTLNQSLINMLRVVRMLGDFQHHGSILRRYYKHKELLTIDQYKSIISQFQQHCQERQYSKVTCNHYRKIAERFLSFLESQAVMQINQLEKAHIPDYITTLAGYGHKTVELQLCGLRCFLRFIHQNQWHTEALVDAVPSIKVRKQTRIPSVWKPEDVEKLIEVIDRGNPAGKRDYAMILLAARLGMRTIDIKRLQLDDLRWPDSRIEIRMSKTAKVLTLPMLPDVGWAIIEYLKNGRPKVESPYVFLRHLAPLVPFSEEDRLHQIIAKYMRLAHIPISPHKKRGMHSLRHTLATKLLAENTPLPIISDILGHANTDSTAVYLKVDIDQLRRCALDGFTGEVL